MRRILVFVGILFCFATINANAADLMEVYHQALVSDPTFQSAQATYLAATEAYPQARAELLPFLDFTANARRVHSETVTPSILGGITPRETFNTYSYQLSLTQPIIDFSAWSQLHLASFQVKEAAATYAAAAQDLILRTARAYFAVLEAEDNLRFTKAEKRATERQLDQATQRYKVGLDAITSVYDAQATYDIIVAQEIAAKNDVVNNREELREITGKYYEKLAGLKKKFPLLHPHPYDVERWVDAADKQNFSVQASRFGADAARENIKVQFGGHLPTLDFTSGYRRLKTANTGIPGAIDTKVGSIGLQLDLPVFQGGLVTSQTRQAEYDYQNALAIMEGTYRQTTVLTRQTYNSITAGISKIKADKQAIISQQASLNATEAALKVGTRTMVDLLIAQQNLYEGQKVLAGDQYAYINNTLQLKELAGTLNLKDIQIINSWLSDNGYKVKPKNIYKHSNFEDSIPGISVDLPAKKHIPYLPRHKKVSSTSKQYKSTKHAYANKPIYTIQLMASVDKQPIEQFVSTHRLKRKTWIGKAKDHETNWFILLYGQYPSFQKAKAAMQQLPNSLQNLSPWVRRVSR